MTTLPSYDYHNRTPPSSSSSSYKNPSHLTRNVKEDRLQASEWLCIVLSRCGGVGQGRKYPTFPIIHWRKGCKWQELVSGLRSSGSNYYRVSHHELLRRSCVIGMPSRKEGIPSGVCLDSNTSNSSLLIKIAIAIAIASPAFSFESYYAVPCVCVLTGL